MGPKAAKSDVPRGESLNVVNHNKKHHLLAYWLPLGAYCVAIFIQSSGPAPVALPGWDFGDKLLHLAGYAVLGALCVRALGTLRLRRNLPLLAALSILFSLLYGVSDEIHQYFVPSRQADVLDVLFDGLGGALGVWGYLFLEKRLLRTPTEFPD